MLTMQITTWHKDVRTQVGTWVQRALLHTLGPRYSDAGLEFTSDWTPLDEAGNPLELGYKRPYLQVKVGGDWKPFHKQLWQDANQRAVDHRTHHVHHDRNLQGGRDGRETNNKLDNLSLEVARDHMAMHGAEGGRPAGSGEGKRQWSAAKTRPKKSRKLK